MNACQWLLLCFTAVTVLGCTHDDTTVAKEVPAQVVVLCDVSNSTTLLTSQSPLKGRLDKLKDYVYRIPRWFPLGSRTYFYAVSSSLVSEQISPPVWYNIQTNSQVKSEKRRNDSLVKAVQIAVDSLAVNAPNSCLLFSIERAINLFKEQKRESSEVTRSNQLVIVSDMLESCRINEATAVRTTVLNTANLTAALNAFEKDNPQLNVSGLDLTVRVIINSPWMGERFDTVRTAWQNWFKKIGVREEKLLINTVPPEDAENPVFARLKL